MDTTAIGSDRRAQFELRFQSLFDAGRGLSFPCDREGHVDLDLLPERARCNYLYARTLVGRDFASPQLRVTSTH